MKKLLTIALIGLISFASCKKDDSAINCTDLSNNATKAAQAYGLSQTAENCQAYKKAMTDYVNSSCFTSLSSSDKEMYNAALTSLSCE